MAASPSPADSSDEPFPVGSVLDGRYRIDGVLGTGGMGRVYRAEHTKIGKSVAIKVLHADLGRNREASQRFQREAIASGRLDHPNIVGVSDFGVLDTGACFLVMEVLEGESLGDRLARDKRIHWAQAIEILRGVLYGLRHAHERGVVHRDIKPDNVFLAQKDGEPVIKILDFGIAKLFAGADDDPASTRAGLTVGTPAYLSPEQAVGSEITPASDLYSASIVLYEMLAGRAPFEDKDPLAMLGAHVSRKPPAFADVAPGVEVPAALEEIVQRGLVKLPANRIRTAIDYLALLEAFSPAPLRSGTFAAWPERADRAERSDVVVRSEGSQRQRLASVPDIAESAAADLADRPTAPPAPPVEAPPARPAPAAPARTAVRSAQASLTSRALAGTPVALAAMPQAGRTISLADAEPIPLSWIVRSGVVIGAVIIAAIAMALAARCTGSELKPRSTAADHRPAGSPR